MSGHTMIRVGSLEGFCDFVLELGADPSELLFKAGIQPELLNENDQLIPSTAFRTVLNLAVQKLNCPQFGLLLSQRQSFTKLGAIGYLARYAPNLSESIQQISRFLKIHDTGSVPGFEIIDNTVLWIHRLIGVKGESAIQQTELTLGLTCRFIRSVLTENWCPEQVLFEHAAPRNRLIFDRIFRCPVRFNQAITAISFSKKDLTIPFQSSDPCLFRILQRYIEQLEVGEANDFPARVRKIIHHHIESMPIRLQAIASIMGLSSREIQSGLRAAGTDFQSQLDEVRYELARRYLRETRLSIAEITALLGYSETAVFTRAFTRLAGTTPRNWRRSATTP